MGRPSRGNGRQPTLTLSTFASAICGTYCRAELHRDSKMQKLRQLYQAGPDFIVTNDSGSRANPHHIAASREVHILVEEVGVTPMEIIMAASRWAAVVLQKQNEL